MVKLSEIYDNVENPLDNPTILQKIIEAYSKSSRTDVFGSSDIYNSLVKMNQTRDNSGIDLSDKEVFLVETYNQWIDNVLNLGEQDIKRLEGAGIKAKEMQEYLQSFGKVSSLQDIQKLTNNPLFDDEKNGWEVNDGWEHIKSQYISARKESRIPVKHRLYVGCQNQDMWKLAREFKNKCEEQQIPYYFKLGSSSERDDKMVIYADTENLANYIDVLQKIAQEKPEIIQRCGEPPALTGKIDGWIGIGDEPPLKENGKNQSYNSIRADIFENAIEETLLDSIAEYKGKDIIYNGKQTTFNDVFIEQAMETIVARLDENKEHSSTQLSKYGLREEDLSNAKFKEYIKKHLRKQITKGLEKLVEVKDKKAELGTSNREAIFNIPTREGKNILVDTIDMDSIIKSMIPVMQQIDPNFTEKVKSKIQEKCNQNGIDETFCFRKGTKERFESIDEGKKLQSERKTNVEKNKMSNDEKVKNRTTIREMKSKKINSIEIVNILNPELMKRMVKLTNGVEIPAKQYIQEVVAPHIPSNGKFILKSNNQEISAKQFIEEIVMGEGQEKYNGDINALLEEMTVANNGIINIDGNDMKAIDIVDSLNPELMKRMVKLTNGVEIPAKQYIQEVVAPHIPSNGKFILKSNNQEISAKQFIEEAVMFECQEKYDGDINALLEAMTVANNGTVSIDMVSKDGHKLELKQEQGLSQAQFERKQEEKEIEERAEQKTEIQGKLKGNETKNYLKRQVISRKIDKSEKEQQEVDIAKDQRKRLLFKKSREGVELSQEERLMLEEMQRQRMQSENTYKDKRENKKWQGQLH